MANIGGIRFGQSKLPRFIIVDTKISAIKYHITDNCIVGTKDNANDTTKAMVAYDINSFCKIVAAVAKATTPINEIINQEISGATPAKLERATPTNGNIASPVPTNAVAAERNLSDLL